LIRLKLTCISANEEKRHLKSKNTTSRKNLFQLYVFGVTLLLSVTFYHFLSLFITFYYFLLLFITQPANDPNPKPREQPKTARTKMRQ